MQKPTKAEQAQMRKMWEDNIIIPLLKKNKEYDVGDIEPLFHHPEPEKRRIYIDTYDNLEEVVEKKYKKELGLSTIEVLGANIRQLIRKNQSINKYVIWKLPVSYPDYKVSHVDCNFRRSRDSENIRSPFESRHPLLWSVNRSGKLTPTKLGGKLEVFINANKKAPAFKIEKYLNFWVSRGYGLIFDVDGFYNKEKVEPPQYDYIKKNGLEYLMDIKPKKNINYF